MILWPRGIDRPFGAEPRWVALRTGKVQHWGFQEDNGENQQLVRIPCGGRFNRFGRANQFRAMDVVPLPLGRYRVCRLPECQQAYRTLNPVTPAKLAQARSTLLKIDRELA